MSASKPSVIRSGLEEYADLCERAEAAAARHEAATTDEERAAALADMERIPEEMAEVLRAEGIDVDDFDLDDDEADGVSLGVAPPGVGRA